MSFTVATSKRFLKSATKLKKAGRGYVLEVAEEAIFLLSLHDRESFIALGTRWRDHPLKGDKRGIRELHLGFDDLLLYRIDEATSTVELLDITNHDALHKR